MNEDKSNLHQDLIETEPTGQDSVETEPTGEDAIDKNPDEQDPVITPEKFHKPTRRELFKMILGAYIGFLPFLISFIVAGIIAFLILLAWGG